MRRPAESTLLGFCAGSGVDRAAELPISGAAALPVVGSVGLEVSGPAPISFRKALSSASACWSRDELDEPKSCRGRPKTRRCCSSVRLKSRFLGGGVVSFCVVVVGDGSLEENGHQPMFEICLLDHRWGLGCRLGEFDVVQRSADVTWSELVAQSRVANLEVTSSPKVLSPFFLYHISICSIATPHMQACLDVMYNIYSAKYDTLSFSQPNFSHFVDLSTGLDYARMDLSQSDTNIRSLVMIKQNRSSRAARAWSKYLLIAHCATCCGVTPLNA